MSDSVTSSPSLLCIPNFSEGRRESLVDEIIGALDLGECDDEPVHGSARLLHRTSDIDHDRTVLTLLGSARQLVDAVDRLAQAVVERIDLREQQGVHPRVGALDVVPFVPLGTATLADAVAAAHQAGERLARRAPVFFYEAAASNVERRDLAAHRRGGLDVLLQRVADGSWLPDLGPHQVDPRVGVMLVGARGPLIAFNVELDTSDVRLARRIAKRIRQSAVGGLPGIKALGVALPSRGITQVSVNVVSPESTSLFTLVQRIRAEAKREGARVIGSELIGLMGRDAALAALAEALGLDSFGPERLVESHLEASSKPSREPDADTS